MYSSVAQLVEQATVNRWVGGSSPSRGAILPCQPGTLADQKSTQPRCELAVRLSVRGGEHLTGIDHVRITDLVLVGFIDHRVLQTLAVQAMSDSP